MTDTVKTDILLLYKEPYSLFILKEALQEEGYNIITTHNGEEALKYLMRRKPDLISIDINLPRKSGIMFYHALRRNQEWSRIPLVTISGESNGQPKDKNNWDVFAGRKVFGPSIYLEKPVRLEDFLELIHRALGKPPEKKLLPTEIETIRKRAMEVLESADDDTIIELATAFRKGPRLEELVLKGIASVI